MRINFNFIKSVIDKLAILFSFFEDNADYKLVVERKEKDSATDNNSNNDNQSIE